jgi:hypothetical protein
VTGGEGFTGRHLIPELKHYGYTIVEQSESECDLRDPKAITALVDATQPDCVIHLAAISFVAHGSPAEIYEVNTIGTTNLLDALSSVRPDVRKVIVASSSQVYGPSDATALDEVSPCHPVSHYACSKLAMEHMAATYGDRLPILKISELRGPDGAELSSEDRGRAIEVFTEQTRAVRQSLEDDARQSDGYFDAANLARSDAAYEAWNNLPVADRLAAADLREAELKPGEPTKWVWDADTSRDENYLRTRAIGRELTNERTAQLLSERGVNQPGAPSPEEMIDTIWNDWKENSASDIGLALQLASAEELGAVNRMTPAQESRGRTAALNEFTSSNERSAGGEAAQKLGMDRLKAYVRGQWETTQYILNKAGTNELQTYRAIFLSNQELATTEKRGTGYVQLPSIQLQRNAAASATMKREVANEWQGVDRPPSSTRVVLRFRTPRTAAFSLPVYGKNVSGESEVVILGEKTGLKWDAWQGEAPDFSSHALTLRMDLADKKPIVVDLLKIDEAAGKNWLKDAWKYRTPKPKPPTVPKGKDFRTRVREALNLFNPNHDRLGLFTGPGGDSGGGGGTPASGLEKLVARLGAPDSGFSYHAVSGKEPHVGFMVSIAEERVRVIPAASVKGRDLTDFVRNNWSQLRHANVYFGAWHSPDDGQVYLDISQHVRTRAEAIQLGRAHRQQRYFDVKAVKSFRLHDDPENATINTAWIRPLGSTLSDPATASPPRSTISWPSSGRSPAASPPLMISPDGRSTTSGGRPSSLGESLRRALTLDWDESLHPRADDGKFTDAGGSHGSDQTPTAQSDAGAGSSGRVPVSTPAPGTQGRPDAVPRAHEVANAYNAAHGFPPVVHEYVTVDEPRAGAIADAYDALPANDSANPEVAAAYGALATEIQAQWDHIRASGVTFEPWTKAGQPYATSKEMAADVKLNQHMYFFTGGEPHPLLGARDPVDGLSMNDKFRAVHDYFGHAAGGYGFGARGEENAWRSHSQMLSWPARRALTTETRGQNSWVNFGRQNYNADGSYKNLPPQDRPYATQKVALLPDIFVRVPGEAVNNPRPTSLTESIRQALELGGQGSGNFGHAGRPGEVGGSADGQAALAEQIARSVHAGQVDKAKEPYIGHIERVAAEVSDAAKPAAWLHDSVEDTKQTRESLLAQGVSAATLDAVDLLTRDPKKETYDEFITRIAESGNAIAIEVKLADLHDNLRGGGYGSTKKYQKAINQLAKAQSLHLEWDEALHPRDDVGRFTESGSDGGTGGRTGYLVVDRAVAAQAKRIVEEASGKPNPLQEHVPAVQHSDPALEAARAMVANNAKSADILAALGPSAQAQATALFTSAYEANSQLSDALDLVSGSLPTSAAIEQGPIKSQQRSVEKVVSKDSWDLRKLRDPVRATIAVATTKDVPAAVLALQKALTAKGGQIVRAEDRFSNPLASGYRDLQLNVRLPNGVIGEVQINLKSMLTAKNSDGHKYYEEWRRIAERQTHTAADLARMSELMSKSKELYDAAYHGAGG